MRTLLALPLVFVLPGAALLRAAGLRFPPLAQVPIVAGVSMATVIIGGLMLDLLGGLSPLGWASWLGGISILTAAAAVGRRAAGSRPVIPAVTLRHGIMLAAAGVVATLTFIGASHGVQTYHPFDYTSFWMLPEHAGIGEVYRIGIKNGERQTESYSVRLMVNGQIAGEWRNVTLAPEQVVTYTVTLPPDAPAQAWLFRTNRMDAIYRAVTVAGKNRDSPTRVGTAGEEN